MTGSSAHDPIAQMGRVAALELPHPLQLDAVDVLEEPAAGAEQDRDKVDLQLVELARAQERLGGARRRAP